MKPYIEKRVIKVAKYIIKTDSTIRKAAVEFDISKASIHRDIQRRLPLLDDDLNEQIKDIMAQHNAERYRNGGTKTKEKYERIRAALEVI